VVSGGHTNLYLFEGPGHYELLAKTRDDAAGEAFDKLAKKLELGYPGGPVIDRLARLGNPEAIKFTLPKISDQSLDFSFSGLKTAALRYIESAGIAPVTPDALQEPEKLSPQLLDLVASYQNAAIAQLVDRLRKARELRSIRSIQISGGVSCNRQLRHVMTQVFEEEGCPVYFPRPALTTDNAAMIAAAAYHRLLAGSSDPWTLSADPNLALSVNRDQSLQ
ncbi:MAG TPA: tRNA (adenosine(37)-N6)-threonylcarbamoyltransferase complex transferase subunit TsaD, partial [Acidobacteriota bacterium]|nr:tRNA (adenosine(37)-N6)-threonylcarbamoyltransferase complex transferase subunit TsaD [Acidobacteriota bacterium]